MPNTNTFAAVVASPKQVINATAETVLVGASAAPVVVGLTNNSNFDGARPFVVRARGVATGGTGATLQFKLYRGSSATLGNDTLVATFTVSAAIPVGGSHFNLTAALQWDSISQAMSGSFEGQTGGTATAKTGVTTQTGIASQSAIQFVLTATFGAALATNSVTLTEFIIDQA